MKIIEFLNRLADDIFFNDLLEKKIAKINKFIGNGIWQLMLSKQDSYFTKGNFVFEPRGMKRV